MNDPPTLNHREALSLSCIEKGGSLGVACVSIRKFLGTYVAGQTDPSFYRHIKDMERRGYVSLRSGDVGKETIVTITQEGQSYLAESKQFYKNL